MKTPLSALLFFLLVVGCEKYEPIEKVFLISENQKTSSSRAFDGCVIRYNLGNYYARLSETLQKQALDKAFALWQKTNPNVLFIGSSDTSRIELSVKFVSNKEINIGEKYAQIGIMKTPLKAISLLKQVKSLKYEVLLDNSYTWDEPAIIRTLSYHIGSYLGIQASNKPNSVMYSEASNVVVSLSKEDSIQYNQLYPLPCKDFKYELLPIKLKLSNIVIKEIKLDKAGIYAIKSTGKITVGSFIGDTTPDGKFEFTIAGVSFDIAAQYDIDPTFPHGAVIYKINNDKAWKLCKSNCEFSTLGNEYLTLTLFINDTNVVENIGAYDVVISYK